MVGTALVVVAVAVSPVERTEGLITAFKSVEAPKEGTTLPAPARQANEKAFASLDGYIDFDAITDAAIAPHRKHFGAAEIKHYKDVFRELIRLVAYPDSGRFLGRSEIKVGAVKPGKKTSDVPVHMAVPADDLETHVTFHWADQGGVWRLVDVSFDGASLVKDYQNQFGRIIEKDGAKGLLDKLDKRLDKERRAAVL